MKILLNKKSLEWHVLPLSLLLQLWSHGQEEQQKNQGVPITSDTNMSREKSGQEIAKHQEPRNKWHL